MVAAIATVVFVLAAQAEPISAAAGYICGGILALAVVANLVKLIKER